MKAILYLERVAKRNAARRILWRDLSGIEENSFEDCRCKRGHSSGIAVAYPGTIERVNFPNSY